MDPLPVPNLQILLCQRFFFSLISWNTVSSLCSAQTLISFFSENSCCQSPQQVSHCVSMNLTVLWRTVQVSLFLFPTISFHSCLLIFIQYQKKITLCTLPLSNFPLFYPCIKSRIFWTPSAETIPLAPWIFFQSQNPVNHLLFFIFLQHRHCSCPLLINFILSDFHLHSLGSSLHFVTIWRVKMHSSLKFFGPVCVNLSFSLCIIILAILFTKFFP